MDVKKCRGEGTSLIIALTSYGGHMQHARGFEWEGVLRAVNCHKLFLKDSHQHWYHGGLDGLGDTLDETVANIRSLMEEWGATRIMCLGSSMGGYGALLLGALLRADLIVAISPQVNITAEWMEEIGDRRWEWKMAEINWWGFDRLNLLPLYEEYSPPDVRILFSSDDYLDYRHAQLLTTPGLAHGVPIAESDHEIAYPLARSGLLTQFAQDFVAVG